MKILVGGFGTRGDVQPMLALALALRGRGHAVTFVAPPDFEKWAAELQLPFVAMGESMQSLVERTADRHGNIGIRAAARELPRMVVEQFREMEPIVQGIDALAVSSLSGAGVSLAEKYGFRYHFVLFTPSMVPSRDHPAPFVMSQTLPRWVNRLSWRLNHFIYDTFFRRLIDRERARLGLPPIRTGVFDHIVWNNLLVASEPSVAGLPPETPGGVAQTGAWFMPEPEELDAELVSFLDAGPPPVYIGFGSMPDKNPLETSRRVLEAVQGAGVRALLSRGWAGLGKIPLPDTVRVIGPTPHGKLFPRCGAVVHHGGAGTTAQAARAGVPQVIVPHLMDQFFWCHRIHKLGLSPPPIHRGKLRAAELSQALRACIEDGAMRERARTFARGMALDGLERAVQAVENGGAARLKAAGG